LGNRRNRCGDPRETGDAYWLGTRQPFRRGFAPDLLHFAGKLARDHGLDRRGGDFFADSFLVEIVQFCRAD
jgi:hypothetical protein